MDPRDMTSVEIISVCGNSVPVGTKVGEAIEAHKEMVRQRQQDPSLWFALTAIILASTKSVEESQQQLDYLTAIPSEHWPPTPAPFCNHRQGQLDAIRRSIAWQQAN
jgi:hypothetical protein